VFVGVSDEVLNLVGEGVDVLEGEDVEHEE
jgi:hypothetical protein